MADGTAPEVMVEGLGGRVTVLDSQPFIGCQDDERGLLRARWESTTEKWKKDLRRAKAEDPSLFVKKS
jgi:hypothetical protein